MSRTDGYGRCFAACQSTCNTYMHLTACVSMLVSYWSSARIGLPRARFYFLLPTSENFRGSLPTKPVHVYCALYELMIIEVTERERWRRWISLLFLYLTNSCRWSYHGAFGQSFVQTTKLPCKSSYKEPFVDSSAFVGSSAFEGSSAYIYTFGWWTRRSPNYFFATFCPSITATARNRVRVNLGLWLESQLRSKTEFGNISDSGLDYFAHYSVCPSGLSWWKRHGSVIFDRNKRTPLLRPKQNPQFAGRYNRDDMR